MTRVRGVLAAVIVVIAVAAGSPAVARAAPAGESAPFAPAPFAAVAAPAAAPTGSDLRIVTSTRYTVQPDRARVHVNVDATLTNAHRDTTAVRSYFDSAFLSVLPDTTGFSVSSASLKPSVTVQSRTADYTVLSIALGQRLYGGQSMKLRLTFNVPDRGGDALRTVRVGASLVAFPVWAYATAGASGSSVSVAFPAGYHVAVQGDTLDGPTAASDGSQVFTSGPISKPLTFVAYLLADRAGAFAESTIRTSVGGANTAVVVRAWADDPTWAARVSAILKPGLPALATAIGVPIGNDRLVVQEAASRTLGGYSGLFDPGAATIQVAYSADPFIVLHESAHAWFNGRLAGERWINEAFASWYATVAAQALNVKVTPPALTDEVAKARIPLNAWAGIGRSGDPTEEYAYAATLRLAGLIAARAGPDGLQRVWQAAAAGQAAYQRSHPGTAPELGAGPPDWRGLLDFLESQTGASYADLWTTWVLRPEERPLLTARAAARSVYAGVVAQAGDWELPTAIRSAMSAWQFDQATALLATCRAVLGQRTEIAQEAAAAGLTVPDALQRAFEGPNGPGAAASEADSELIALDAINAAAAAGAAPRDAVQQVGLLGSEPDAELAAARAWFQDGNAAAAGIHAATAEAAWRSAADRGTQRLASAALIAAGLVVLLMILATFWRARRHAPGRRGVAAAGGDNMGADGGDGGGYEGPSGQT